MLTSILMSDLIIDFYTDAQASLSLIFIWVLARGLLKLSRINLRPNKVKDQCHPIKLDRPILNIPALIFRQYFKAIIRINRNRMIGIFK